MASGTVTVGSHGATTGGADATRHGPTWSPSRDRAADPSLHTRQRDLEQRSDRDIEVGSPRSPPIVSS
jgi:hypothetical protein